MASDIFDAARFVKLPVSGISVGRLEMEDEEIAENVMFDTSELKFLKERNNRHEKMPSFFLNDILHRKNK